MDLDNQCLPRLEMIRILEEVIWASKILKFSKFNLSREESKWTTLLTTKH